MSKNIISNTLFTSVYKFYVDNDSNIYVPLYDQNKVIMINKYGIQTDFVINVQSPYAVYGDENSLYVVNRTLGVFKYNKSNGTLISHLISMDSYFQDPISISIYKDYLFLALYKNDILNDVTSKICIHNKENGRMITYIESSSHPIALPQTIIVDQTNNNNDTFIDFYVANNTRNLSKFSFDTNKLNIIQKPFSTNDPNINVDVEQFQKIRDFALDNNDNFYISSNVMNFISKYDSNGNFIQNLTFKDQIPKHLFIRNNVIYFSNVKNNENFIALYDLDGKSYNLPEKLVIIQPTNDNTNNTDNNTNNNTNNINVIQDNNNMSINNVESALKYMLSKHNLYSQVLKYDNQIKSDLANYRVKSSLVYTFNNIKIDPYTHHLLNQNLYKLPLNIVKMSPLIKPYAFLANVIDKIYNNIQSNLEAYEFYIKSYREAIFYKFNVLNQINTLTYKRAMKFHISSDFFKEIPNDNEDIVYSHSSFVSIFKEILDKEQIKY